MTKPKPLQTLSARSTVETILQALRDYKELEGPQKPMLVTVEVHPQDIKRCQLQTHEGMPVLAIDGMKLERILLPSDEGGLRLCLVLKTKTG